LLISMKYPNTRFEADLQGPDAGALALALLDRGDRGAAAVADALELVQLRVDALADEAAVLDARRRLVDERRLDVRCDVERRLQRLDLAAQQRRPDLVERGRRRGDRPDGAGEPLEVARAGGAERHASHDAVDVLHGPQRLAQRAALAGAEGELLDGVQPVLDLLQPCQRPQHPVADPARAHGGLAQVEHREQRALATAVLQALGELQVAPRERVHHQAVGAHPQRQAGHVREVALLRLAHVTQDGAARRGRLGQRLAAERLQGRDPEVREQVLARRARVDPAVVDLAPRDGALGQRIGQPAGAFHAMRRQDLPRARRRELVAQRLPPPAARPLCDEELSRRRLQPGGAEGGRAGGEGHDEGALAGLDRVRLELRARRHHPHHLAPHDALGAPRVFHLLAERDAVALLDEPRDVRGRRVVGDAAHRDGRAVPVVRARGERDLERLGRHHRVLEEHLVEVAHAEEEQRVGCSAFIRWYCCMAGVAVPAAVGMAAGSIPAARVPTGSSCPARSTAGIVCRSPCASSPSIPAENTEASPSSRTARRGARSACGRPSDTR
jgi:hypothetical protein